MPPDHIVIVRWLDARGASPHWQTPDELTDGPCKMVSVGFLAVDEPDHIALAPHRSVEEGEDEEVCGVMYIPRAAITRMDAVALPTEVEGEDRA